MRKNVKWRGVIFVWAIAGSGLALVQACSSSDDPSATPRADGSTAGNDAAQAETEGGPPPSPTSPGDAGGPPDAGPTSARLVTGGDNTLLGVTDDGNVIYIDGAGAANAVPIAGGAPKRIVANAASGFVSRDTAFVWSSVDADAGGPSRFGSLTTWKSGVAVERGGRSVVGIGAAAADGTVAYLTKGFGAQASLVLAPGSDAGAPVTIDVVFIASADCVSPRQLLLHFDVGPSQRFVAQYCPSTSTSLNVVSALKDGSGKLTFASRSVVGALTTGGGRIAFVQAGTSAGGVLHIANPEATGNDQTTGVSDVVSAQFIADASAVVYVRSGGKGAEVVPVAASAGPSQAASILSADAIGLGSASSDGRYLLTYSASARATSRNVTNVVLSTTSLGVGGGGRVLEADASSSTTGLPHDRGGNFLADNQHVAIIDPLDPTGMYGPMRVLPLDRGSAESVAAESVWEFRPLPVDAGAGSSVGLVVQPTPGTYAPPSYSPTFDLPVRDVTGALPARTIATGATAYFQRGSQAELVYSLSSPGAGGIYVTQVP